MPLTPAACYRAVLARDPRHDGRFFTCVKTTGIYCRPICPARPPKLENCSFVPTAAAAQAAGYRPCLRCRPESSPDLDAWRGTSATVSRALKLIESGALDGGTDADVTSLANRLNIGDRHLRRLFAQHVGAAPVTVAQTRRVLLAKQLLHQTDLPMIDVALASGFGSVRRFNETFQHLYQRPPSDLRRRRRSNSATSVNNTEITLCLPYRPPYDWPAMLDFLRARAIAGMELVTDDDTYTRLIELAGQTGSLAVSHAPAQSALRVIVRFPNLGALPAIITRVRRMFDLSADPTAIANALAADPLLAPRIAAHPGLRLPGAWDPFEIAVRAVLGQQITLKSATQLVTQLVAATAPSKPTPVESDSSPHQLTHTFPRPEHLTATALAHLKIPKSRAATLLALATAAANDPHLFDPHPDLDQATARLRTIPGVGDWTAHYIAVRALGETDAFPHTDAALLRNVSTALQRPITPTQLLARANRWRPWRAYALLHCWTPNKTAARPTPIPA